MTILDASIEVLKGSGQPMTADEIEREIRTRQLFEFKVKDPVGMVRTAIRKHLRKPPPHRVELTSDGRFGRA